MQNLPPKEAQYIFPFVCHFIFAIIIANSYEVAAEVFLRPEVPIYSSLESILPAMELVVAYTAIISGWIGYSRSMIKWPQKDTKYGTIRFFIDLIVLFCYFGLIDAADPESGPFKEQFLSWMVMLFVLFMVWDGFKWQDHKSRSSGTRSKTTQNEKRRRYTTPNDKRLRKSAVLTVLFLIVFAIPLVTDWQVDDIWKDNQDTLYAAALLLTIALLLAYRYLKWPLGERKRRRGASQKAE